MPALTPAQLIEAIEEAFIESTASAALISAPRAHPRRFYVVAGESTIPLWVYIWTLTHGGGAARHKDEYRIQLTGVKAPLAVNPDGPTILLGYEPNLKCFAGFDLRKHKQFSRHSPSIQININTLRDAHRDGFAFVRKDNDEIAIGFRPDNMLSYALNSESLHESGADARISNLLNKVTRLESLTAAETAAIPPDRRRVIAQVSRLVRDSDFRRKVTIAYDRKCAVTGLQLRLIDAAHILPVGAVGSTDDVANGICLSPSYHRAYDRGLIYLTDDRRMLINERKKQDLVRSGLGGGLAEFEAHLGRQIILPADRAQWPRVNFIRNANRFRDS